MRDPYHVVIEREDGYHVALVRPDNGTVTGVLVCGDKRYAEIQCAHANHDLQRRIELMNESFKRECEAEHRRTPKGFYEDNHA